MQNDPYKTSIKETARRMRGIRIHSNTHTKQNDPYKTSIKETGRRMRGTRIHSNTHTPSRMTHTRQEGSRKRREEEQARKIRRST